METGTPTGEVFVSGNQRFSVVPVRATEDNTLSDSVYRTLACLGKFADKDGWCWPSLATLAEMRGVSKPRISQDIKILKEKGYIKIERQSMGGIFRNNKYQILYETDQLTPEVNSELTSEVNCQLTSEVNLNAPINAPLINAPIKIIDDEISGSDPVGQITKLYQENIGSIHSPIVAQDIIDMVAFYPMEWIEDSIRIAVENNARSLSYIKKVLYNWHTKGRNWKPGYAIKKEAERSGILGL